MKVYMLLSLALLIAWAIVSAVFLLWYLPKRIGAP